MGKAIKGLLFDKDGTLFDFHKTWGVWCSKAIDDLAEDNDAVAAQLADVLGFDRVNAKFHPDSSVIAGTLEDLVTLVHSVFPDRERASVHQEMLASATDVPMVAAVPLIPLLDDFRARSLKLGVATNDAEGPARSHLEQAGILGYFNFIAGYDSGHGGKPEPGMLLAFANQMGLNPTEVAMIGDSTHDLHAGLAAGMVRVGVLTGMASRDDLTPHADVVLGDIGELPAWLDA